MIGILLLFCEENVIEGLRIRLGGERVAPGLGQFDDAVPALGRAHDAADGRQVRTLEGACNDAVGRDHELFNERRGAILLDGRNADDLVGNQHRPGLDGFKVERTVLEAIAAHALRGRVLQFELRGEIGIGSHFGRRGGCAFEPRSHAGIGQLRAIVHQGAVDLLVGGGAIGSD